jgi:3-deoxy-D-manno-octulosonate 8-phosphate phosphatase (KDO 8-P phosphatase)
VTTPRDIRLIVFDVDGVLTDGGIIVNDLGHESKRFHVRDGFAIRAAMKIGLHIGVITGRTSRSVLLRITELQVPLLLQGVTNKAAALEQLCQRAEVSPLDTAYLGDDLIDLPAMLRCGYPMAVADAVDEVRAHATYVTTRPGGHGAAREAIEHILKSQGRWEALVQQYGM